MCKVWQLKCWKWSKKIFVSFNTKSCSAFSDSLKHWNTLPHLVWSSPFLTALVRLNTLLYLKQELILRSSDVHKIKTWWLKNLIQAYSMCYFILKMISFLCDGFAQNENICRECVGGNAGKEFLLPDMFDPCNYVLGFFYKYINKLSIA